MTACPCPCTLGAELRPPPCIPCSLALALALAGAAQHVPTWATEERRSARAREAFMVMMCSVWVTARAREAVVERMCL